jgi:hypothetical protein
MAAEPGIGDFFFELRVRSQLRISFSSCIR